MITGAMNYYEREMARDCKRRLARANYEIGALRSTVRRFATNSTPARDAIKRCEVIALEMEREADARDAQATDLARPMGVE